MMKGDEAQFSSSSKLYSVLVTLRLIWILQLTIVSEVFERSVELQGGTGNFWRTVLFDEG